MIYFYPLLQRVLEGEEVIIVKAGHLVAILSHLPSAPTRRIAGNDAGKVTSTPAFDEPLSEFDGP